MFGDDAIDRDRKRVGWAMFLIVALTVLWLFSPGMPILFAPSASESVKEEGRMLFEHEWTPNDSLASADGLGPVFNERSCVACHFQGGLGGGGALAQNVHSFLVLPKTEDEKLKTGLLHAFATDDSNKETMTLLKSIYPTTPGSKKRVENNGCHYEIDIPPFDPIQMMNLNATPLFGAGWIDRISAKSISNHQWKRGIENTLKEFNLDFDKIPVGRPRIHADGRVGRFGWKAQFATLEEFVASACANELGLGNPILPQAIPLAQTSPQEMKTDLDKKQFRSLVAFVDTLSRPEQILPAESSELAIVHRGQELFHGIACAACHVPDVGGVKGVYSDFLLHKVESVRQGTSYGQLPDFMKSIPTGADDPLPSEWRTPPLWGVADSAPYMHDGGCPTLHDAILQHGGDAKIVRKAYENLADSDQKAIFAFLKTLRAPKDAPPVEPKPGTHQLASK